MSIKGIGVREVVALGALVFALFLGFLFFDPTSTDGAPGGEVSLSARERLPAEGLSPWRLTWIEGTGPAGGPVAGEGELRDLDVRYEAGPFPDVKDDAWTLFAAATFSGQAGRYTLELSYIGSIGLSINGEDRKVTPETGPGTIHIPFQQPESGVTTFNLRLRDTGGPAALSAHVTK